jgi:hypothetical protein
MDYPQGSFGADLGGRRIRLLDAFAEKQRAAAESQLSAEEAMSVDDFPTYILSFSRTTFLGTYEEIQGNWPAYTHEMRLEDFEDYTSFRWGRFPNWPERPLNADVEQAAIREFPGPAVKLKEWALGYSVTRQLILADRLNKITELPAALGAAGARTVSTRAVSRLEANPVMFDSNALFSAAHNNIGSTALTADQAGANALKAAFDAIDLQTDDEGYKLAVAGGTYVLIVPRQLRYIARALRDRTELPVSSGATDLSRPNEVAGMFEIAEERFLTDATNWYLALNPTGPQGFLAALNLNGNTQPYLGQKDDKKIGILGRGEDPYTFRFDELEYMGRHDFDFSPTEFRSVFGAIVAG